MQKIMHSIQNKNKAMQQKKKVHLLTLIDTSFTKFVLFGSSKFSFSLKPRPSLVPTTYPIIVPRSLILWVNERVSTPREKVKGHKQHLIFYMYYMCMYFTYHKFQECFLAWATSPEKAPPPSDYTAQCSRQLLVL